MRKKWLFLTDVKVPYGPERALYLIYFSQQFDKPSAICILSEETEAQSSEVVCPGLTGKTLAAELAFKPKLSVSEPTYAMVKLDCKVLFLQPGCFTKPLCSHYHFGFTLGPQGI